MLDTSIVADPKDEDSDPDSDDLGDDDDLYDLYSPVSSPGESPGPSCTSILSGGRGCPFTDHSAPTFTEDPFETEAGKQITQALGVDETDGATKDSRRAHFLEAVTRQLITNPQGLADLSEQVSEIRADPDIELSSEEDEVLGLIEAGSKVASGKCLDRDQWTIDERSETSQEAQAAVNATYAILEESPAHFEDGEW